VKAAFVIPSLEGGSIEIRDIPVPEPGPGEVLVRVRASGLNRAELGIRRARARGVPGLDPTAPVLSGGEFAGEVAKLGEGVTGLTVGQRVMSMNTPGARAEYVIARFGTCIPIPDNLSFVEAASIPTVFITAHDAIVTNAQLKPGESLMVNAASSGVGIAAIQVASVLGAKPVIGMTRSAGKLDALRAIGMDEGVIQDDGFGQRLLDLTGGKGVDVVVDNVGGPILDATMRAMALRGRLVSVGRLSALTDTIDLDYLALRRLHLIGVTFRTRTPEEYVECSQRFATDLMPHFASGRIRPVIHSTYTLDDLDAAQQAMARNEHIGKIVLRVD